MLVPLILAIMKTLLTLAALSTLIRAHKQHDDIGHVNKYHGEDWYDCGPYGGGFLSHGYSTENYC